MCIYGSTFLKDMIYPKDVDGNPLYNPYGKYVIKFYVNGCYRSVIIDDKLLVRSHSSLVSGQSVLMDEMWVSLIEKAALKVYIYIIYNRYMVVIILKDIMPLMHYQVSLDG